VVGKGFGLVDILDPDSGQFQRSLQVFQDHQRTLGLALAPRLSVNLGPLVGNFGSTIMTFEQDRRLS
jgi:hypothetical protein